MIRDTIDIRALPPIHTHMTTRHRHDINTEMVPVLYERFLVVKAGLDFALCATISVGACVEWMTCPNPTPLMFNHKPSPSYTGCLIRGSRLQSPAALTALAAIFQCEEVACLWLMYRMSLVPLRYLVLKEDASQNVVYLKRTLTVALGLGLLFMVMPLGADLYGDNGLFFWFQDYRWEAYAFYWLALVISLACLANFVRVSCVSEHRRRRSLHVRYGDYFTRMTVEIAVILFFDYVIWLLPYFLRAISLWYAFAHGGHRSWSYRVLDAYSISFRGAVDALVYIPKDFIVTGGFVVE